MTGLPVAVLHAAALQGVLGALPDDPVAQISALRGRVEGLRLLPYTAVGVPGGMLAAFRPESLRVEGQAKEMLLALSPTPVSADDEYDLLLPYDA